MPYDFFRDLKIDAARFPQTKYLESEVQKNCFRIQKLYITLKTVCMYNLL